ncbi:protein kilB [Kitasatospora phosalacinea]|uniref:protein kilB n=1 Tax=Kitasatospora phosalacinea TaxID=2065 RepID=UPI00365FF9AF
MAAELVLALVGVGGTIAATLSSGLLQHRAVQAARAADTHQQQRRDLIQAVTDLAKALAAHRRAMHARERLRLTGADDAVQAEARSESHRTRTEITAPLTTFSVLAPTLADAARGAARASYALRNAHNQADLDTARTTASTLADELVAQVAAHLAT